MVELETVLVATDCSQHGSNAVITGVDFVQRVGASFEVVSIVEPVPLVEMFVPRGEDTL
jgi:hypothetical protein